jgi:membrane protease subunit (stomatin/prohibitin family)
VRDNGLGDGGAMVFGMNLAGSLDPRNASVAGAASAAEGAQSKVEQDKPSIDSQVETLKKLKELLDAGILTQDEFDAKKRQVLGL